MTLKGRARLRTLRGLVIFGVVTEAFAQQAAASERSSARPRRQVIVSIPDRKLVGMEGDAGLAAFPVAVGAPSSPSPTGTGTFTIASRLTSPTYSHARIVIPPGKENPLGPRWVGLNKPGYGMHGTNRPGSVGKAASHGCIRPRNRDIVHLFVMVRVGDSVEIQGERDQLVCRPFGGDGSAPATVARTQTASPATLAGGPYGGPSVTKTLEEKSCN